MKKATDRRLFFVLRQELSADCDGYLFRSSAAEPQLCPLKDLSSHLEEGTTSDLIVAMPGSEVLQAFVNAPRVGGTKLAKALYWSVEPLISNAIDDNEVLWRRADLPGNAQRYLTLVAAKQRVTEWNRLLAESGLAGARLTSLSQLLAGSGQSLNLDWQGWALWENAEGMGCFPATEMGVASSDNSERLRLVVTEDESEESSANLSLQQQLYRDKNSNFIDLAARDDQHAELAAFFPWKKIAAAGSLSLAALICYFLVMGAQFNAKAEDYRNEATAAYRAWFPEDRRIFNLRRQLEGKLRQDAPVKTLDSVTSLLEIAATSLEQSANSFRVERMRYQGQAGAMEMVVVVASMDEMDALADLLAARSIDMQIQSATRRSAGLEVGLVISANQELAVQ